MFSCNKQACLFTETFTGTESTKEIKKRIHYLTYRFGASLYISQTFQNAGFEMNERENFYSHKDISRQSIYMI